MRYRAIRTQYIVAEFGADVHLELPETGHAVRAASPVTTAAEIDADVHLELPETGHVVCAASPVSTAADIAAEVVEYSNSNDSEVFPYVGVPNFSVFLKAQPEKINAEDDVSIVSQTAERNRRDNPKVFVKCSTKMNGRRVFDKKHFCLFCAKASTNLSKHLLRKHASESIIKKVSAQSLGSSERKHLLEKVRNLGDYQHNCDVLTAGEGQIIPWRSPPEPVAAKEYVPCPDCYAFFQEQQLWRHHQVCQFCTKADRKHSFRSLRAEAELLLPGSNDVSDVMRREIFTIMVKDEVSILARNDPTITDFGEKLLRKHGHLKHLHVYISTKMRELARLVLAVRRLDPSIVWLDDCLQAEKFDVIIRAVRVLCGFQEEKNKYAIPSLALKLGHSMKKCCAASIVRSIKKGDGGRRQELENFAYVLDKEWTSEVSCVAHTTLTTEKMNKPQLLPLTEDIVKLNSHVNSEISRLQVEVQGDNAGTSWQSLATVTLAAVVLFNRRRSGEAERMLVDDYRQRNRNPLAVQDIADSLSEAELVLCRTMTRVEIRGKKGRSVPVILTTQLLQVIDLLVDKRRSAGVPESNPYIFARTRAETPLRASDCLRRLAVESGAQNPSNLTSTRLRKHIATVSQILNLQECEMDLLAGFLGHDIRVHRTFYRLPEDTLQLAKVSKILLAFDRGNIAMFKGKSLDEIDVNNALVESDDDDTEDESSTGKGVL